ncbi:receptor-transporting protein 3-like [Hemicordylus capensis]|uniref:receptor-transporting protein 3-like n=1 Tax=Hemicordylus capensis TaxID=884348 RepID=UPI00230231A3|nr:receptor-transporting protein 3-like [Hemicordylus capensis]
MPTWWTEEEHDSPPDWRREFIRKMKEHKPQDNWVLTTELEISQTPGGWYQYEQKRLFASFKCSNCSRDWKSAQVAVVFRMRLERNRRQWDQGEGQVKMKALRQKCNKCQGRYQEPIFSEKMVQLALHNLVVKILEKCYRESNRKMVLQEPEPEEDVEGPHDKANCEACELGLCSVRSTSWGQTVRPECSFIRPASLGQSGLWEQSFQRPSSLPQSERGESMESCCKMLLFLFIVAVVLFLFASFNRN